MRLTGRNYATETDLWHDLQRTFGQRPELRLWRQNTGAAMMPTAGGGSRLVHFGIPGQADVTGIGPGGRRIELELKIGNGRARSEQLAYVAMVRRMGGVAGIVRSPAEVAELFDEAGWPGAEWLRLAQ